MTKCSMKFPWCSVTNPSGETRVLSLGWLSPIFAKAATTCVDHFVVRTGATSMYQAASLSSSGTGVSNKPCSGMRKYNLWPFISQLLAFSGAVFKGAGAGSKRI